MDYVGIHWMLVKLPIWASALILYTITLGVVNELRDRLEGVPYQVARSAQYGDAGLIIAVLIAGTVLQRGEVTLPTMMTNGFKHAFILAVAVIAGGVVWKLTKSSRDGKLADMYHDLVIAPLIVYFAVFLLPVIFYGGTALEKFMTGGLIGLWLMFVVTDVVGNRMNQRQWLRNRGLKFQD